jgi:transcriptional regulator with XRE-family HTH domain
MENLQNIHIGSIIKEVFTKNGMTITDFSHKINRERTTIYDIFNRKSIDIDLLIQISNVLEYDFIHEVYFPQCNHPTLRKMLIAVEVDVNEINKIELPKELYQLVKAVTI